MHAHQHMEVACFVGLQALWDCSRPTGTAPQHQHERKRLLTPKFAGHSKACLMAGGGGHNPAAHHYVEYRRGSCVLAGRHLRASAAIGHAGRGTRARRTQRVRDARPCVRHSSTRGARCAAVSAWQMAPAAATAGCIVLAHGRKRHTDAEAHLPTWPAFAQCSPTHRCLSGGESRAAKPAV